jgi:carboxymethylenebutenolidase
MCFDLDSRPPIAPIAGGALDSRTLTLTAADGTHFRAFEARASAPSGAGIVILPDVRGLHPYYEELALRFAEHAVDAVAIDYFGRTAGTGERGDQFEHMNHVNQTTWAGISADVRAAAEHLRNGGRVSSLFTIGFCFGGRNSFDTATLGLGLAGVIGFYGVPHGPGRNDAPMPTEAAPTFECPVLAIFGGADKAISDDAIRDFERALEAGGVEHRIVVEPDAPHSFFDRKATDFAEAADRSWTTTLQFVRSHTAEPSKAA